MFIFYVRRRPSVSIICEFVACYLSDFDVNFHNDMGVACVLRLDHVNLSLSIRSSQTQVNFLNTSLTFYDCSVHRS